MVKLKEKEQDLLIFGLTQKFYLVYEFGFKDQNIYKTRSGFYMAMKKLVENNYYAVKKIKVIENKITYQNRYRLTFDGELLAKYLRG